MRSSPYTFSQYTKYIEEKGIPDEIIIRTVDYNKYLFADNEYQITGDTLTGTGKILFDDNTLRDIILPVSEIYTIEIRNDDLVSTIFLVLAIIGAIGILAASIAFHNMGPLTGF